jgi:hypothetical protein
MAKRVLHVTTVTPTATADTTNLVDSTYMGHIQPSTATQRVNILEVMLTGQAGASSPSLMVLARDSQVSTGSITLTAGTTDSNLDASTAALASVVRAGDKAATNKPQRGVNDHLLNLAFNAFGGIVRWVAAPGEEISVIGQSTLTGEVSLSAFTGGTTGLMGSHIIYEPS